MQIKLTPVSEGGLIPTTLDDLVQLCRSTPTAPICSPLGDAVEKLCTTLPSLPLCAQTSISISGALGNLLSGGGPIVKPSTPTEPNARQPAPDAGGGGSGGSPLQRLLGGLLGGGTS